MSSICPKNFRFFLWKIETIVNFWITCARKFISIQNMLKKSEIFSICVYDSLGNHDAKPLACHSKIRWSTFHCNRSKIQIVLNSESMKFCQIVVGNVLDKLSLVH